MKKRGDYKQVGGGDCIEADVPGYILQACCDCGLVHFFFYHHLEGQKVFVKFYRDEYETDLLRARYKFTCVPRRHKKVTASKPSRATQVNKKS